MYSQFKAKEAHMSPTAAPTDWKAGLEDVVATRSAICAVDGAAGRLYYRGYEIGDLAGRASFEAVTHLLWFGELPGPAEGEAFAARLARARGLRGSAAAARARAAPHRHTHY